MRAYLVAIVLLAGSAGLSHAQESFDSIIVPCNESRSETAAQLPPKLAEWARLNCTRFGQVVRAASGWVWHNPKTNSFVRVWSQPSDGKLMEVGQASYFKSLEYRQLSSQEADAANVVLAAELGADPQAVVDAYALTATDAQGRTQVVNFVRSEANARLGTFWGWSCALPCSKPQIFMGFKQKP